MAQINPVDYLYLFVFYDINSDSLHCKQRGTGIPVE